MARKLPPSKEYLQQFSSPLWNLLDLEDCKPLTIIEGHRGAFAFRVIEMQHSAYGPLSDNGKTAVSTFFIVKHLKELSELEITKPPHQYQVSADRDYVYLVAPSKKVRPSDWEQLLKLTINIAESLCVQAADRVTSASSPKTFTPVGAGILVYGFWCLVCLIFAIVSLVYGIGGILGMTRLSTTGSGSAQLGWQFLLFSAGAFWGALLYYKKIKKRLS